MTVTGGPSNETVLIIKIHNFSTKNENFPMRFPYCKITVLGTPVTYASPRESTQLHGSLEVAQEVAGGRSDRFRVRTDVLSDPEHTGNHFGELKKNQKI